MRLTLLAIVFALCSALTTQAPAQSPQQVAAPQQPETIAIGQTLDAAMDILRRRGIEFGEGGFSFAMRDPDASNLHFTLDPNHTRVALFYSKSRRTVTGVSMFFFPSRLGHAKSTESQVPAQAIFLYPDGNYAVRFTKPPTLEELNEFEANLPKSTNPPGPRP